MAQAMAQARLHPLADGQQLVLHLRAQVGGFHLGVVGGPGGRDGSACLGSWSHNSVAKPRRTGLNLIVAKGG